MLWLGTGPGALGFAEWLLAASSRRHLMKAVDFYDRLLDGFCCYLLLSCLRYVRAAMELSERKGKDGKCPFPLQGCQTGQRKLLS